MFEKEIKFIADFNLNKVKSFGSFITFEKLLNSSMHPAVIRYISAELDYLISEDRKRILQESVFDYSGQEAAKYFNLIAQEIKKSKEISYEDLKKLVIQAVSFNLNFLSRPKWSLSKLIYNDAQDRTIEEIKLNLSYIYYYDYIKSIFLSYISKRKLSTLSITEFELILNKIDNELFATQPQKLVDYSLYSIAEFFNLGDVNKTKISVLTLELFLKEKNLMEYLFRLRKAVPEDANQRYEVEEIKNIIYSSAPVDARPIQPAEEVYNKEIISRDKKIIPEDKQEEIFLPFPSFEENKIEIRADTVEEENIAEEIKEEEIPEESAIEEETIEDKAADEEISEQLNEEEIIEEEIKEEIKEGNFEQEVKTEFAEQNIEAEPDEKNVEKEITEEPVNKINELAEEPEETESDAAEPEEQEIEDSSIADIADEEKFENIIEAEDHSFAADTEAPEEEIKIDETKDNPVGSLSDEEFFSLFSEEVKKVEESDPDFKPVNNDQTSEPQKEEEVDSFLDFEEETENLLRAFKETEEEMNLKDIDIFKDTTSKTDKAAMDLIKNFHEESDKKDIPELPKNENNTVKPVKKNGKYKEKKIRNLLDFMSNNDIEKIIANVFNDDKEDFTGTMEKLNECNNYDEATEILKSVFITYRVNPYTKDALTLTNSVANYFTKV